MKKLTLSIFLFLITGVLYAQQRDLSYYLQRAEINSPLINKSKNEAKIAELDLKQIKAFLTKPEINIEANVMLAPIISHDNNTNRFQLASEGAVKYNGYDLNTTDGGAYQALVSIKQPLFTNSIFETYSKKADLSAQQSENNIALTTHELEQVVSYQYILCLKSKKQIKNNLLILKEFDEQLAMMKKLVDNAIYKQTDLMLLQIERQNYENENENLQSEYRDNLYDLNLVCGIDDTNLTDIKDINFQLKANNETDSHFLTSFKLDSLNIMAEQMISELKYKPQINWFADAGLNANYQPTLNRIGFSTGISLSWNIFDGNQKKIQNDKSIINLSTIDFEKQNFITQNKIYKDKILEQISSVDKKINFAQQQTDQYKQLLDIYSRELSNGEISVMDYKNLQKDLIVKKQEIIQLEMEKQALINSYNYWNY